MTRCFPPWVSLVHLTRCNLDVNQITPFPVRHYFAILQEELDPTLQECHYFTLCFCSTLPDRDTAREIPALLIFPASTIPVSTLPTILLQISAVSGFIPTPHYSNSLVLDPPNPWVPNLLPHHVRCSKVLNPRTSLIDHQSIDHCPNFPQHLHLYPGCSLDLWSNLDSNCWPLPLHLSHLPDRWLESSP